MPVIASFAVALAVSVAPVRIGVLANLSGGYEAIDRPAWNGMRVASRQIDASGGVLGRPLELVIRDTKSSIAEAEFAARELCRTEKVSALIGFCDSNFAMAAGRVARQYGVPFLTPGATLPGLPDLVGVNFYMACFGDDDQARAMATFARQEGMRSVAVIEDTSTEYTQALSRFFRQSFTAQGGEIAALEANAMGDRRNVTSYLQFKSLYATIDAVFLAVPPDLAPAVIRGLRQSGYEKPILGGDSLDTPAVADLGEVASGVVFATHLSLVGGDSRADNFVRAYRQNYGVPPPNAFAALGYDAVQLMRRAIEAAGSDQPSKILRAFAGGNVFDAGVTGDIRFPEGKREPIKPVTILRIEGGVPRFVTKVQP